MKKLIYASAILFSISVSFAQMTVAEPDLEKIPHHHTKHQDTRIDNYFWLKDRTNPSVINYLNSENAYAEEKLKDTHEIQEKIYQELRSRIKEDDTSMDYQKGDYRYYSRTLTGKEYKIYCRKKGEKGAEEVLLDLNKLAVNKTFLKIPEPAVHFHKIFSLIQKTLKETGYTPSILKT